MDPKEMAEYSLTVEEVAERWSVTPSRVRQLIANGRLIGLMRAGAWFFKPATVDNFQRKSRGRPKKQK